MNTRTEKVSFVRKSGFSLIELMIVIVIMGILTAIAVPSYSRYVVKSKRAAAYGCLTQVGAVMEQIYADGFKYNVDLDGDGSDEHGSSGVCASDGSDCENLERVAGECLDEVSSHHTIRLGSITAKKFTLVAATVTADYDEQCGKLTLNQNGKISADGALGDDCFSE